MIENNSLQADIWKQLGKTHAILIGRFQPLHNGHIKLINLIIETGLELHIFMNSKLNTEDERNPYSIEQKLKMFKKALPDIDTDNIHMVDVYLGRKGDVTKDATAITQEICKTLSIEKSVIFYTPKKEDIKSYILNGNVHENIHYIDLLAKPLGKFDKQIVSPELTNGLLHATNFRNNQNNYSMLDTEVADYIRGQKLLAELNHRKVGDSKSNDDKVVDTKHTHNSGLPLPTLQSLMLVEGKSILIEGPGSR